MAVSKVVLGDETLIDLTGDSVSSENLLQGATAHAANGEQITGGVVVTPMYTGTKAAIEEAIALGQIPEDAVVNITDDEETSSFQTQINEINSSLNDFLSIIFGSENPTLQEVSLPYTATDNCFMIISASNTVGNTNQYYLLKSSILNDTIAGSNVFNMSDIRWIPIKKGDTISLHSSNVNMLKCKILK